MIGIGRSVESFRNDGKKIIIFIFIQILISMIKNNPTNAFPKLIADS